MKRFVLALLLSTLAAPTFAADDCPPGGVKHAALTGLDHASMEAAVLASFRGLYHRDPSGIPGSGPDDIGWWITTFDHFGAYGDAICRAGWNAYAELRLSGANSGDSALGDQPARFQPTSVPVVVPPPNPPPVIPVPVPSDPNASILSAIADLKATMQQEHAEQTRSVGDALKNVSEWALKYLGPAVGAWIVGHQMAK